MHRIYNFLGLSAENVQRHESVLMFAAINLFRWLLTDEHVRGPAFVTIEQRKLVMHPALQRDYLEMNQVYLDNLEPENIDQPGFLYRSKERAKCWKSVLE